MIDIDDVVLLHFERLIVVDETAVEEETERVDGHAYALGIRFFQLAHLGGHLDAEVDFVGVLSDNLQLDVLGLSLKQDGKKKVLNCPSVEIRFIQTKLKAWISVCSDKI